MTRFERCIVVDSLGKPMVFITDQFVYTLPIPTRSPQREKIAVLRSYTIKEAKELINRHITYRSSKGWDTSDMQLIPFKD